MYIVCSNTTLVYKLHYRLYVTGNVYNSVKQYNILLCYRYIILQKYKNALEPIESLFFTVVYKYYLYTRKIKQ